MLMQDCPKYGVVLILTQLGVLYLYEVSTAALLHEERVSTDSSMIASRPEKGGVLVLYANGDLVSVSISKNGFLPFLREKDEPLAKVLTLRFGLGVQNEKRLITVSTIPHVERGSTSSLTELGHDVINMGPLSTHRGFYRHGFEDEITGELMQCWCKANFDKTAAKQV